MGVYYFIGVGGSGMSAIAQVLASEGHAVLGSDRSCDRGQNAPLFAMLEASGVRMCAQDGSGVTPDVDFVVVSTAIEDSVPDMRRARELGLPVKHRAELLADIVNARRGIAVGGTSGKSTVTGMIGWALFAAGLDPTVINGGRIKNFETDKSPGNTRVGGSDIIVVESDESDGSIVNYRPEVSVVTNVTLDHKPIPELRALFETFIGNTRRLAVIGADCPEASTLNTGKTPTARFSLHPGAADVCAENISLEPFGSSFRVARLEFKLNVPGLHNVANALACIAVCRHFGIPDSKISEGLAGFKGIGRRFDVVGETGGVTVIDDFAHNPDKIRATLETLARSGRRKLLFFQPHGFAPTLLMKDGLIEVFTSMMASDDVLFLPEIFYAGGTAARSISSADIAAAVRAGGRNVFFAVDRKDLALLIRLEARTGDIVAVMGARDDSLTQFCRDILASIRDKLGE